MRQGLGGTENHISQNWKVLLLYTIMSQTEMCKKSS